MMHRKYMDHFLISRPKLKQIMVFRIRKRVTATWEDELAGPTVEVGRLIGKRSY